MLGKALINLQQTLKIDCPMSTETKIIHMAMAVIPFTIKEKVTSESQTLEGVENSDEESRFSSLCERMTRYLRPANIIDTTKYHDYLPNYISEGNHQFSDSNAPTKTNNHSTTTDSSFIRCYKIDYDNTWRNIQKNNPDSTHNLPYNPQIHHLRIAGQWEAEFLKSSFVFINPNSKLGFIALGFDVHHPNVESLQSFEKCVFFRFIENHNNKNKDYCLHLSYKKSGQENSPPPPNINLYQILRFLFHDVWDELHFVGQINGLRPIRLHLFNRPPFPLLNENTEKTFQFLYDVIRIPRAYSNGIDRNIKPHNYLTGSKTMVAAINEGAAVIDHVVESTSDYLNKYLPAFILALNQRQNMMFINKRIASIPQNKLFHLENENSPLVREFAHLKKTIDITHLKQVFFSISFVDEIAFFYHKVQQAFQVEVLLQDNKDCVSEIYTLLETNRKELEKKRLIEEKLQRDEEIKRQEEAARKQENRDKQLNIVLAALGCLGIFGFFKDFFPFWTDRTPDSLLHEWTYGYKWLSVLLPLTLCFYFIWSTHRIKNK